MSTRPSVNPFLAYAEGESFLREQLSRLSVEQLATIVSWYQLPVAVDLTKTTASALADEMTRVLREGKRPVRRGKGLGVQAG